MKKILGQITYVTLITLVISFGISAQAQTNAYRVSDREVKNILDRIETRTDAFKSEINRALDNSRADGTNREDAINSLVGNFENATNRLKNNFSSRRSSANDVQEVLNQAVNVNTSMQNNRLSQTAQNQWNQIRDDLDILAGYYRVRTNWNDNATTSGSQYGYYASDTELRSVLDRLRQRGISFRQSFDRWNRGNRRNRSVQAGEVSQYITEFERAVQSLRSEYNNRNSNNGGVEQVLRPSASINSFISTNRTNRDITNKWNLVRNDVNTLAGYYRVSWDWENPVFPGPGGQYGDFDSRLTGTYRLNRSQSDSVTTAVDRAIVNAKYDANQRDRVRRNLERRLLSPETLTLEKRGQQVTMSSANASSLTLEADGATRSETSPNGRTVRVSVISTSNDLTINYEGDRINDYYISFEPTNNGQLRVTRRIYLENQNETVTVTSVYDKVSQIPQWNTATYPDNTDGNTINGFLIPNNTGIVATLDSQLSTNIAKDGDRFSLTVTSPSQYNGAVIEGNVVGEKSGVVSGRANLSLSFDTIRMRDGRTYRFAGIVEQVRQPNGDIININNEGTIRDSNQTTKTVTRAGIGAALGALIGAIAGGGSGAAIGAGIGAGAGAGTVILQGRDNLELPSGTEFTITATAPTNFATQ